MTTERTNQLNTKANHIERDEIVCVQCAWARALARARKHRSKWIKIVQVQVEWDASKINSRWCFCGKQISRCFSFLSICKWYLWQKFIAHFSPSLVLFLLFFRLFNLFHILLLFFIFFLLFLIFVVLCFDWYINHWARVQLNCVFMQKTTTLSHNQVQFSCNSYVPLCIPISLLFCLRSSVSMSIWCNAVSFIRFSCKCVCKIICVDVWISEIICCGRPDRVINDKRLM